MTISELFSRLNDYGYYNHKVSKRVDNTLFSFQTKEMYRSGEKDRPSFNIVERDSIFDDKLYYEPGCPVYQFSFGLIPTVNPQLERKFYKTEELDNMFLILSTIIMQSVSESIKRDINLTILGII